MAKSYSTHFELSVKDIDLIEKALRSYDGDIDKVQQLLGKIHNQKIWYRPSSDEYVSG